VSDYIRTPKNNPMANITLKTAGVHHITLRSANLTKSRTFYTELLGFPVLLDSEELLIVGIGNCALAIRGIHHDTKPGDRFDPYRVGLDHFALLGTVAEIDRVAALLKKEGVWTSGPKLDETLGKRYLAFKDPDGIKLELYEA
jgi:glyoxylase I family protein